MYIILRRYACRSRCQLWDTRLYRQRKNAYIVKCNSSARLVMKNRNLQVTNWEPWQISDVTGTALHPQQLPEFERLLKNVLIRLCVLPVMQASRVSVHGRPYLSIGICSISAVGPWTAYTSHGSETKSDNMRMGEKGREIGDTKQSKVCKKQTFSEKFKTKKKYGDYASTRHTGVSSSEHQ